MIGTIAILLFALLAVIVVFAVSAQRLRGHGRHPGCNERSRDGSAGTLGAGSANGGSGKRHDHDIDSGSGSTGDAGGDGGGGGGGD